MATPDWHNHVISTRRIQILPHQRGAFRRRRGNIRLGAGLHDKVGRGGLHNLGSVSHRSHDDPRARRPSGGDAGGRPPDAGAGEVIEHGLETSLEIGALAPSAAGR